MSSRKRKPNLENILTEEEKTKLRQLANRRLDAELTGSDPENIDKILHAEDNMFESTGDSRVNSGYKKISDLDGSQGTVIHHPTKGENVGVLTKDGNFMNMDGSEHPVSQLMKD
jgi:hypothetical protein